jgi:ArsR family transcriptional regulator
MESSIILDKKAQSIVRYYLPSNSVLIDIAEFFSVFCDPTRVKMLSALSITEMCVSDLASTLDLNQSTVSHQLKFLKGNGMVKTRREGKIIFYSVSSKCIDEVMNIGLNYLGLS